VATNASAASVTQSTAAAAAPVGHYRWYICALLFFATTVNYVDRQVIGVLAPELQQTLENLREQVRAGLLPDDVLDFRAVAGDDGVSVTPSVKSGERGSSPTVREGVELTVEADEVREIARSIHGETYRLNAETFFQTNHDLLPQLIDNALKDAAGDLAIDLYCGVGLFTLRLARTFKHVIGVEGERISADFARLNLANAGLINAEIANQDVGNWSEGNSQFDGVDFLLLDPPRAGAESRVITAILDLQPKRICYVSCDPATLARDLKKLIAGGYVLGTLAAFDMFPQTHHVETVVHLTIASSVSTQGQSRDCQGHRKDGLVELSGRFVSC